MGNTNLLERSRFICVRLEIKEFRMGSFTEPILVLQRT